VYPVGIGLRDPRSQKRDLGHPSTSPFDAAEGTSFVVSLPTRLSESAARDDKGKGCSTWKAVAGTKVQPPLFMAPSPSPLSSRAKPRDLQFYGPFLEMFFSQAKEKPLVSKGLSPSQTKIKPRYASIFPAIPQESDPAAPVPGPSPPQQYKSERG
jgi:hypothetical protein